MGSALSRRGVQSKVPDPSCSTRDELTFAQGYDDRIWICMCSILRVSHEVQAKTRDIAKLPLVLGVLGLRSAVRTRRLRSLSAG